MMGGRPIVPGDAAKPPYWRFNRQWRQLYLSSYHVSRRSAPGYIEALRTYGSKWMTGYGSAIAALAESAWEAGVEPYPLRAVIVSGDTLLPAMRSSIERFFRCRCFDSYGQSEGVATTMECAHGRMHVLPQVGIVEILGDDGSRCAPGETGEIVATGLLNRSMPLIRYRTGDRAAWSADQACACGTLGPIIESLEGRVDDYLETRDGRRIGRLSTAVKRSPSIHSAQIVQDRIGHAYLLVRPGEGYRHEDSIAIREDLIERIGDFELEIVEVAEIPKTPTGKMRLVVRLSERSDAARAAYDFLTPKESLASRAVAR
jgi:phenylacetate-CoA ligase